MSEDIQIYFEWADQEKGIQKVSIGDNIEYLKNQSEKAMNLAMGCIRKMADEISATIKKIDHTVRPDEIEVEFSLKLDVEAGSGVIVPLIAKTKAGGQFTVHFKWNIEKPTENHILVS